MLFARRFVVALAALAAAYGAYALAAAPWLEPPPVTLQSGAAVGGPLPRRSYDFDHLFPPDAWQRQHPKVVETAECTLLLQDYHPHPDGRMELKPCTLIFYSAGGERDRPLVLDAPQGAVLQFDQPLDLTRAEFGRLVGGKLNGDVRLFSPPSAPQASDSLQLLTRNVQIDARRVWTPNEVRFEYGASYGRGRDLTLTLLQDETATTDPKAPVIAGVQQLQLAQLDVLHLAAAGQGILPASAGTSTAFPRGAAPSPPVEIRCQGPLKVDFVHHVASVEDRVEVTRANELLPPDRLTCQRLTLKFRPPGEDPPEAPAAPHDDSPAAAMSSRQLQSRLENLQAIGAPVVLDAPSSAASVRAARVDYDFVTRRLLLAPGGTETGVSLRSQQNTFEARQLEYELAEAGRLGRLWAEGPGRLRAVHGAGAQQQVLEAGWQKELRIRPQERNQVISLVSGAVVRMPPGGEFSADELHLWVTEQAEPKPASPAGSPPATALRGIVPDRLLAIRDVRIESPQVSGRADRLEAWFTPAPPALPQMNAQPPPAERDAPTPVRQPEERPTAPAQHFEVTGRTVRVQFLRRGSQQVEVEDLAVEGDVRIAETQLADPAAEPLLITGQTAQLRGATTPDAIVQVVGAEGEPALLSARGLQLQAAAVNLHRGQNRAWIEGRGLARLPLPQSQADLQPGRIREPLPRSPQPTAPKFGTVEWEGGLEFDGLRAHIEGNVVCRSDLQLILADALDLVLSRKIDFLQVKGGAPVDVAQVVFHELKHLENTTLDAEGKKTSYDLMNARRLTLDRAAGKLRAEGPGWVSTVRSGGLPVAGAAALPAAPSAPSAAGLDPQLTYLHVAFQEALLGDLARRQAQFRRQVRATYGVVREWDQRIEIDRPQAFGERGALVSCEQLTVTEMNSGAFGPRWVELEATSNTLVEAQAFTARAHRLSYATEKELLVLEGDGRSDAEFWHQTRPGGPRSYSAARKIMYWRKTNTLEVDDARQVDLQQLNGLSLPGLGKPMR